MADRHPEEHQLRARSRRSPFSIVLTAAIVAVLVASVAGPADAASKKRTRTQIAVSQSSITVGASVTITGRALAKGAGVKKVKLTIQQRQVGKSAWKTVATARVNSDGRISVAVTPSVTTAYRVKFPGAKKFSRSVSRAVTVTVSVPAPPPVVVTPTPTPTPAPVVPAIVITSTTPVDAILNDIITVNGTVTTNLIGAKLYLARWDGVDWVTTSSVNSVADANGNFTISGPAKFGGAVTYAVQSKATSKFATVLSNTVAFSIWAWNNLPAKDDYGVGSKMIGVTSYAKSPYVGGRVADETSYSSTWTIGGNCRSFEASVGVGSSSTAGAEADFSAFADSNEPVELTAHLGDAAQLMGFSVAGAQTLTLSNSFFHPVEENYYDYAVWGSARILCLSGLPAQP